jgi:hypothetical protein
MHASLDHFRTDILPHPIVLGGGDTVRMAVPQLTVSGVVLLPTWWVGRKAWVPTCVGMTRCVDGLKDDYLQSNDVDFNASFELFATP